MADGAFWFDIKSGNFVSSTFLLQGAAGLGQGIQRAAPGGKYRGVTWLGHKMPEDNVKLFTELEATRSATS